MFSHGSLFPRTMSQATVLARTTAVLFKLCSQLWPAIPKALNSSHPGPVKSHWLWAGSIFDRINDNIRPTCIHEKQMGRMAMQRVT